MRCLPLFLVGLLLTGCNKNSSDVHPIVTSITQAVYASGRIYPLRYYRVSSKVPGIVEDIYVKAGDSVRKGMPLLKIRSTTSDISIATAENAFTLAQRNAKESGAFLRAAQSEYEAARAKFEFDSVSALRQQRLYEARATSKSLVDAATTQLEVSRQVLQKARFTYTSMSDRADIEQKNARLQLMAQQSLRDDYVIYAAEDGIVYDVVPEIGELISPQSLIMEIGNPSAFEVELSVDETDIALLQLGQKVYYIVDALKGSSYQGIVTKITPRVSTADKTAKVTASIDQKDAAKYVPGMSLEANIVVAKKSQALVIPREFLKAGSLVRVQRGSEVFQVKVTTGIEDLKYVEVISGLQITDVLQK